MDGTINERCYRDRYARAAECVLLIYMHIYRYIYIMRSSNVAETARGRVPFRVLAPGYLVIILPLSAAARSFTSGIEHSGMTSCITRLFVRASYPRAKTHTDWNFSLDSLREDWTHLTSPFWSSFSEKLSALPSSDPAETVAPIKTAAAAGARAQIASANRARRRGTQRDKREGGYRRERDGRAAIFASLL